MNPRIATLIGRFLPARRTSAVLSHGTSNLSIFVASLFTAFFIFQVLPIGAEETYRERMDRLDREDQMHRDTEAYLERWRENRNIQFAAIAYSKSTGKWGYSWEHKTLADASREALRRCEAKDAEIVCWAKNGWFCALADGPKSYAGASAATADEARAKALQDGNKISPGCRIVLCIGGLPQKVEKSDN